MKKLELPAIPESIMGRLKKDGTPDKRYKNGLLMLQEYMEEAGGVNEAARYLGKMGGTATKAKYGIGHFKRISKLGVKARNEKTI